LINLMPYYLWRKVLQRLEKLTAFDGKPWTTEWGSAGRGLNEEDFAKFEKEQVVRMRRLVFQCGEGSKLFSLNLQRKKIGAGGLTAVKALVAVLQEKTPRQRHPLCRDILILQLELNRLTTEYMNVLAPAIAYCSFLRSLSIGDNPIGDEGCIVLSQALPSTLEELHLWNADIGDDGCKAIIHNIPKGLAYLDVRSNNISKDGCDELLKALENTFNCLQVLKLDSNPGYCSDPLVKVVALQDGAEVA